MIRTNLATRPFYNDKAVRMIIAGLGLVVLLATLANVTSVFRLSRRDTTLATEAARDEARATESRRAAARLRASVDVNAIDLATADAREANQLIDRRTFSWTELFNTFEATLPEEVRITTVRPKVDPKTGIILTIVVVASSRDEINEFIEQLEKTGAFGQLLAHQDSVDDEGRLLATIEGIYTPRSAAASKAAGGDTASGESPAPGDTTSGESPAAGESPETPAATPGAAQ